MLGQNIKKLRKVKKISQRELGEMSGVTEGYIYKIEKDIAWPSRSVMKAICDALDASFAIVMK